MTLGQFKENIEELEKAGKITDDFELEVVNDDFGIGNVIAIEVDSEANDELIRIIIN